METLVIKTTKKTKELITVPQFLNEIKKHFIKDELILIQDSLMRGKKIWILISSYKLYTIK